MALDLTRYGSHVTDYFGALPSDSFHLVPCLFCPEGTPSVELFQKGTMQVHRCECGMIWSRRQPTEEALTRFYQGSQAMTDWAAIKDSEKEYDRQKEKFLPTARFLANRGVKSVLDVGCGNGFFLSLLRDLSPSAELIGTDLSPSAREAAASRGITVHPWGLKEALEENPKTYDAITLWGVLEHVTDPTGLLKSAYSRLSPGGLLVICVPNAQSIVVTALWEKCFTFCPQHLWYFDYNTLTWALNAAKFCPIHIGTVEPEVVPTAKAMSGLDPYAPAPEWAYADKLADPSLILKNGHGYKIIAISQAVAA